MRQGKLALRLTREELDALIIVAAKTRVPDRRQERALTTLMRYLDGLEERFAEPESEGGEEGEDGVAAAESEESGDDAVDAERRA